MFKCDRLLSGLEMLMNEIFTINQYNQLVRPVDKNSMTTVLTELKLLQIDLVLFKILFKTQNKRLNFKIFKDEKYQELISTCWVEMVAFIFYLMHLFLEIFNFCTKELV